MWVGGNSANTTSMGGSSSGIGGGSSSGVGGGDRVGGGQLGW